MERTLESIGISNVQKVQVFIYDFIQTYSLAHFTTVDTKAYYTKLKGLGRLKIRIENGVTIISTGLRKQPGIYEVNSTKKYKASIGFNNKYYHIGFSDDYEELVLLRREAEIHVRNGSFLEWFELRKGKKNGKRNKI